MGGCGNTSAPGRKGKKEKTVCVGVPARVRGFEMEDLESNLIFIPFVSNIALLVVRLWVSGSEDIF